MGENPSVRTQRELAELRGRIDADLALLTQRAKEDVDPRRLARRNPVAVFGTLGSIGVLGAAAIARRVRNLRARTPEHEIDRVATKLGARVDSLKGRARKRFRERLRQEIDETAAQTRGAKEMAWTVGLSAATAAATEIARRFAGRLTQDDRPGPKGGSGP